jgi:hypothetical protein
MYPTPSCLCGWNCKTAANSCSSCFKCFAHRVPNEMQVYHLPQSAFGKLPCPLPPGIPTQDEYISMYCARRGIPLPAYDTFTFFCTLAIFRAASILAGVYTRSLQGNAAATNAASVGAPAVVASFAAMALSLITALASPTSLPFLQSPGFHVTAPPMAQSSTSCAHLSPAHIYSPLAQLNSKPPTARADKLLKRLGAFMSQHIAPVEAAFEAHAHGAERWRSFPHMESLKASARTEGLWNLWISQELRQLVHAALADTRIHSKEAELLCGPGLSNVEYGFLAKAMGAVTWSPEVFNCSAPDTGNMEVLARYGSPAQQEQWLLPLLRGDMRSCFAMTEPDVASSDATNIQGVLIAPSLAGTFNPQLVSPRAAGALDCLAFAQEHLQA